MSPSQVRLVHTGKPVKRSGNGPTPNKAPRKPIDVCLVTHDLPDWCDPGDASYLMIGLAQQIAAQGDRVTVLWVPPYWAVDKLVSGEGEALQKYYLEHFLITLDILTSSPELLPLLGTSEKRSAAAYYHLKSRAFDAVYFALEGGLGYYSLLAKELALYETRPLLYVVASSPMEWKSQADRQFLKDLDQVTIAFMEKYCAAEADTLISSSAYLLTWMGSSGWKLPKNSIVLPAQHPLEFRPREELPRASRMQRHFTEIVFVGVGEFREGLTLLCDALDRLASKLIEPLTVTMLGRFGQLLGEHTGGLLLRRARSWPFEVKLLPGFTPRECIEYLKHRQALLVAPYLAANTPLLLSACLDEEISFVTTSVGGIPELLAPAQLETYVAAPNANALADKIADAIAAPLPPAAPTAARHDRERALARHLLDASRGRKAAASDTASRAPKTPSRAPKNAPKVSIIMVHHDRPHLLPQAVEAVRQQDYRNFELILVDDGSKLPESHQALDDLAGEFKKRGWTILREPNRYLGAARNTGVRASSGEFILFVDDDNALFPHAVRTFVSALQASQADICTAFQRLFYEPFIPQDASFGYIQYFPLGGSLDLGFIHDSFGDANAMIRRSVFDKIGYQLEDYGYTAQDWEFFSRAVLAGLKLRVIPEPLYWYRSSTSGMYRNSNWYDNRLPIIKAFQKHQFSGVNHLYHLVLSAYVGSTETEMYRENLRYNVSDERYLQLTRLAPNSEEAIELLAEIAASEGRGSTAIMLLGRSRKSEYRKRVLDTFAPPSLSEQALAELGADFMTEATLGKARLREFSVRSQSPGNYSPEAYIEDEDRFFLPARDGAASVAVLTAGCPARTNQVHATVSLEQAITAPTEFMILLAPAHIDPLLAVRQSNPNQSEGSSGWCRVTHPFEARKIEASLCVPAEHALNLILAVRAAKPGSDTSTLGCFSHIVVRSSRGAINANRPRVGAPPARQRARTWTSGERQSARLLHTYKSELPLLLFPPDGDGIFLRPSTNGVVAAQLQWAFPPFTRKIVASVEVTHDEASPFEFAVALTRPVSDVSWTGEVPTDCVAFSGWIRVEEKFKLKDIIVEVRELMKSHLHVNLAIRLPAGSRPAPANSFFRRMILVWDE